MEFSETIPRHADVPMPGTTKQIPVSFVDQFGNITHTVEDFYVVAVIFGTYDTVVLWRSDAAAWTLRVQAATDRAIARQ